MRVNRHIEAIIIAVIYLTCLYFWTLPIKDNPIPYGEVDAASHYALADYTYYSDRSISELPYYIDKRYGYDNKFSAHTLWYPPPFHTSLAIAAVFGGESDYSIYVANAIFCSLIVLAVYFLVRRLYNIEAALLSSFLLIFSIRDIMIYLWGQWPERMAFAYLPLIIYCFYMYCKSYLDRNEKPIYIYLMSILLALNLFIHPMDFFHSVAALIIITLFFFIKERKLFFNARHISAAIVLFLLIISVFPFQTMNVLVRLQTDDTSQGGTGRISRLFYWFKPQESNKGVPQSYFSYKSMIGPYWSIPLLLMGILFLMLRRKKKDLVILGWLVSLYIMIHLDVIGKGRVHRSLSGTAHIFYPLMALGLIYTFSLIPKHYRKAIKPLLLLVFAVLMFFSVGLPAYNSLKDAYSGIARINPIQYGFSKWLRESTIEETDNLYHMGSISLARTRWLWMIGHRHMIDSTRYSLDEINSTHIIIDYSDLTMLQNKEALLQLQEFEERNLHNNTLVYSTKYIRVYELEN
ncbi:hypothetical protein GF323_04440 [Candidatus Woesearchaeota archaeon]|nr:hypothetical protein [Candidatus Woesearchaeota archaeon]